MNQSNSPMDPSDNNSGNQDAIYINFSDFFRRLRQRFPILLVFFIGGIALAVWVSLNTRPTYESQVRILFPGTSSMSGGLAEIAASFGSEKTEPLDMYTEILKSTQIVAPILAKHHLEQFFKIKTPNDVNRVIKVKTNAKSATMTLTVISPSASLAPIMADEFCESLSQFVRASAISDSKNSAAFLRSRIQDVERRLRQKDEELRRYQVANQIAGAFQAQAGGGGESSSGGPSSGLSLTSELMQVKSSINANRARIAEVRRQVELQVDHPERLQENAALANKWRALLRTKAYQLALAETQYGQDNPQVVLLRNDISSIKSQIVTELLNARYELNQGITPELAQLLAEQEALLAQQSSLNEIIGKIPTKEMKVTQLVRESALLSALYRALLLRYQEAQLAEMNDPSRFVFLDKPTIPLRPARPRWKINIALGGIAGLMLGGLLIFYLPATPASRSSAASI